MDGVTEIAIRELACSVEGSLREGLVRDALDEIQAAGSRGAQDFEKAVQVLRQKRGRSGKQLVQWRFFIPTLVALDIPARAHLAIRLLGKEFRFSSRMAVERRLGRQKIEEELLGWKEKTPDWFLVCSERAAEWHEAWETMAPAFDALRGLIEYVAGFGTSRISTEQEPRARVPHPRWLIYDRPGGSLESARFLTESSDRGGYSR